jgi:fatty-acyl-CoA synthase
VDHHAFASAKAGLILVTINPAYRLNELDYALNKVGCKALVTAAALKTSNYLEMLAALAPEIATCAPGQLAAARVPSLTTLIAIAPTHQGSSASMRSPASRRGAPPAPRGDGAA